MRHKNTHKFKQQNQQQEQQQEVEEFEEEELEMFCRRHPSSSPPVGICAKCLKERLLSLVCSDCGEQRLSNCSCSSDYTSRRNSSVGSVGRLSFLIDSDTNNNNNLRRASTASATEPYRPSPAKPLRGLRRIFSRKPKNPGGHGDSPENSETFRNSGNAVSRSLSLCSFRNHGDFGSGARRCSSVTVGGSGRRSEFSEPRKSDQNETFLSDRNVSEFSGFVGNGGGNRRVFSLRETDFVVDDDSGFIDLKLDFSAESSKVSECETRFGREVGGGSCRITVNDRGLNDLMKKKKGSNSKGWRWIFGNHKNGNL